MDVVVTAWPKFLARVEYLDRCLASLKKYLTVDQQVRWLCSLESQQVRPALRQLAERVVAKHGFEPLWHPGPPNLGRHMNWLIKQHLQPFYFYTQEDFELQRPLDLAVGRQLLLEGQGCVRYSSAEKLAGLSTDPQRPGLIRLPADWKWRFSHRAYLGDVSLFRRLGLFFEGGGQEARMNQQFIRHRVPVWMSQDQPLTHIGEHSVMGHRCPFESAAADRMNELIEAADPENTLAMSRPALRKLAALLREYQPVVTLELGSGVSTKLLANYQECHPLAGVISVEHDEKFADELRRELPSLYALCGLFTSPLQDNQFYTELPRSRTPLELLLVDGPPSHRRGSERAREFLRESVQADTIVVIDDTHRKHNQQNVELIKKLQRAEYNVRVESEPGDRRKTTFLVPKHLQPAVARSA
jgi:hypothetical protein